MTVQFSASYSSVVDKSGWGKGPWQEECDKAQWVDQTTDLDCLIVRHSRSGALCGYVGLPPGHRLHGKDYDDVGAYVHGGLTFCGLCHEGEDPAKGVCHIPLPGRPAEVWWLGFDCNHFNDLAPGMEALLASMGLDLGLDGEYRTIDYVVEQCTLLARQLKEMA